MKKMMYVLLGLMAIGFSACSPDEEPIDQNEATASSLKITMDHKMGSADMAYNEDLILPSLESVQMSRLSYLLGGFYLIDGNNNKVPLAGQYALIEAHKGDVTFTLTDIPFGDYTSVGFSIGLDSITNHGNPNQYAADHPLSPINNSLHWNWTGGYIFTALEGKVVKDDETFVFHLAGAQNRLDFEMPAVFSTSATDADKTAVITYDISEVFKNPEIFTIAEDGTSSHSTTSPVTVKLIRNMSDVFTKFEVN
jgi:hypothetical protein